MENNWPLHHVCCLLEALIYGKSETGSWCYICSSYRHWMEVSKMKCKRGDGNRRHRFSAFWLKSNFGVCEVVHSECSRFKSRLVEMYRFWNFRRYIISTNIWFVMRAFWMNNFTHTQCCVQIILQFHQHHTFHCRNQFHLPQKPCSSWVLSLLLELSFASEPLLSCWRPFQLLYQSPHFH